MLAAIVFTDIVGFSLLMGRDEAGTLAALERDFMNMEAICRAHEGLVMKRTGDGLLMRFMSAVEALQASIEIQEFIREQAKGLSSSEVLEHRIGVHLGDVMVTENDVVGDGVNIAQRLQTEAKPGGICFSQTVYDVVKGKMKVQAMNLGPKHLKHLIDPVVIWAVPPIGAAGFDGRRLTTTAPLDMALDLPTPIHVEPSRTRGIGVLIAIVIAISVPVFGGMMLIKRQGEFAKIDAANNKKLEEERERKKQEKRDAKSDKQATPGTNPIPNVPNPPTDSSNAETEVEQPSAELDTLLGSDASAKALIAELKSKNRFDDIAEVIRSKGPTARLLAAHYERVQAFLTWFDSAISAIKPESPLLVEGDKVWFAANAIQVQHADGTELTLPRDNPGLKNIAAIGKVLVGLDSSADRVAHERGLRAYIREFGL